MAAGNFKEDDKTFTFTDGTGKEHTYEKNDPRYKGMYEVAKRQWGKPSNAADMGPPAALATPKPSMDGTFDPTANMMNQSMNAQAADALPVPQPSPGGVNPGVSQIGLSASQEGNPAAPSPPDVATQAGPQMGLYGTENDAGTTMKRLSPEGRKAEAALDAQSQKSVQAQMAADQATANLQTAKSTAEANMYDQYNQDAAQTRKIVQDEVQLRNQEIKRVSDEYDTMTVDRSRLFGLEKTGNTILAAMGIALGAIGSGLAGRDMGVAQIIQKAIDQDIDAQKADMVKKGDSLKQKRGALADFQQAARDESAARDLEFARQMKVVEKQFEAIAASSSDPAIKAKAEAMKTEFAQAKAQRLANAEQTITAISQKTAPITKQRDQNTQADTDKARTNAYAMASIDRLRELKKKIGTGPIEGRWQSVAETLGFQASDEAEFRARLNALLSDTVRSISGATASDSERDFIKTFTANPNMSDAAFDRNLDVMYQRMAGEQNSFEDNARLSNRHSPNTQGMYGNFRSQWDPNFGKKTKTFKPAGK